MDRRFAVLVFTLVWLKQTTSELTEAECLECGDILQTFPRFAVVNRGDFARGCRLESCQGRRLSCESGRKIRQEKVFSRDGALLRCNRFDGVNLEVLVVTDAPTSNPTNPPTTQQPTTEPTTPPPTSNPTRNPTTREPTFNPTRDPTNGPTRNPTREPTTLSPTRQPTNLPTTATPSSEPTFQPSTSPTTFTPTTTAALNEFPDGGDAAAVIAGSTVAALLVIVGALMVFRRRSRQRELVKKGSMPMPVPAGTPSSLFPGDIEHGARSTGFMSHLYGHSVDYLSGRRHQGRVRDAKDDHDDTYAVEKRQPTLGPPPGLAPLPGASYPQPSLHKREPRRAGNSPRRRENGVETPPPAPPRKRRKKLPALASALEDGEETPPPAPPRARRKKRRGALGPRQRGPGPLGGRGVSPPRGNGSPFPPKRWSDYSDEEEDEDEDDVYKF